MLLHPTHVKWVFSDDLNARSSEKACNLESHILQRKTMKHSAGSYISDLKVMQSNAGYYVGRDYTENSFPGMKMPFSRESDYFATYEQAHNCLQIMKLEMSLEGF